MGFAIPEAALNVTLQEDKATRAQNLNLSPEVREPARLAHGRREQPLRKQIENLQRVLRTGFTPLNWNSQRIPSFIETCDKALNEFAGVVSQIQKSSTMITEVVTQIEGMVLVQEHDLPRTSDPAGGAATPAGKAGGAPPTPTPGAAAAPARDPTSRVRPMDVSELYDLLETKRMARLQSLVQKYRSIESLLKKVEEVVAATNGGMSPQLQGYYHFWEKRIFNAITVMIVNSLATFLAMVQAPECTPFCHVKVTLNGKDLVVTPSDTDLFRLLTKLVKNLVESAKLFVRWMRGTCLECEPVKVHEDEDDFVFSFYQDMSQNQHVVKLMFTLNQNIHKVFNFMAKYLESWMSYDKKYKLWNPKRKQALEKLLDEPGLLLRRGPRGTSRSPTRPSRSRPRRSLPAHRLLGRRGRHQPAGRGVDARLRVDPAPDLEGAPRREFARMAQFEKDIAQDRTTSSSSSLCSTRSRRSRRSRWTPSSRTST